MPRQFVVGVPRRLEWQILPESFEFGSHLALGHARVGDERVHQRTDRRPHVATVAAAVPFQQPAQRAVGQRLQGRRRQPHHVVVPRPQWFIGARRGHAIPLLGIGAGNACRSQPRQLRCGTGPYRISDGILGRADHRAQPADHRRGSKHPRGEHRLGGLGFGVGSQLAELVVERRGQHRVVAALTVDRGDQQPAAGAAHGGDQQPALFGQQRRPTGHAAAVSPATPSRTSTRCCVPSTPPRGVVLGHNPSCSPAMTTTSHSLPKAACALTSATPSTSGGAVARRRHRTQRADMLDEAAKGCPRGPRHILLRHIEQRGDRVEVGIGLRASRAAPLTGRQPALLQARAVPCLPQGVARVFAVGLAAPRGGEHGAHPPQRTGRDRLSHQAVFDSSASTSRSPKSRGGWLRSARRSALRSCRSDTGSTRPMGPVSRSRARSPSNPSAVAASTVSIARAAGCSATGTPDGGTTTGTPAAVSARDSAAPLCRTERTITAICDHGTPSMRWALRSASTTSAARRAATRPPARTPNRTLLRAYQFAGSACAGQPPGNPGDGTRHRGCAAVRLRQRDHRVVVVAAQQGGIGAAVGEHRLVGVTGDRQSTRRSPPAPAPGGRPAGRGAGRRRPAAA